MRLTGKHITIRPLRAETIEQWSGIRETIAMSDARPDDLIGVYVEDLAECVAAVIDTENDTLLWSDTDGEGTPIEPAIEDSFVDTISTIIDLLVPDDELASEPKGVTA